MKLGIGLNVSPQALRIAKVMVHLELVKPVDAVRILKNGESKHSKRALTADNSASG